jgi:nucleotide-binding universal stress UspA family protein
MKTKEFRRILVPIDFSDNSIRALNYAMIWAKKLNCELVLLHIDESLSLMSSFTKIFFGKGSKAPKLRVNPTESLIKLCKTIEENESIKAEPVYSKGVIWERIIEKSQLHDVDLIVMGTHGAKGIENFLAGSNTYSVVDNSKIPVISTLGDAEFQKEIKNILLPIDHSKETRQKVDEAIFVAQLFGSDITVMGCTISDDEKIHFHTNKIVDQVINYIEEVGIKTHRHFTYGENLSNLILPYADECKADLIIIMTELEINPTGFFYGSYSQQIINNARHPIMSIKPKEKESHFPLPY